MLICGIDEAGRGPVLGPMVMAGILIDEKDLDRLKELEVKDSKLMSKEAREKAYEQLIKMIEYDVQIISAVEIDKHLVDPSSNLNKLEALFTSRILNNLKPEKAIIDLPDKNKKRYVNYIKKRLEKDMEIIAEHKADFNYPVVSAASIIAKVTRDRAMEKIGKRINKEVGSGYMSDSTTVKFLEENWDKGYEFIRKKWASFKRIEGQNLQTDLSKY